MPEIAFVIPHSDSDAAPREPARTLAYELELQQVVCSMHSGAFPAAAEQRVYLLIDPVRDGRGAGVLPDEMLLRRTVFLCTEPDVLDR
ncbi:MAG: hypothetical protein ACRDNJ_15425, partial [Solirubrobacteraceae bacterium]